ncbi:MAG TPA: glycoside hydrolase family 31 protein [Kiritimatiellia bacterium]|nr:glycoside hydrolase family 31 protein [Kiritimatiellia bacterium]HPS08633.1 glycoside hydrolase family 31 protein [Kiritimatiellia bacterium]
MKTLSAWRVAVAFFAGAGAVCAAESNAVPVWADTAPLTAQNAVLALEDGTFVRVDVLGERLFRIRHAKTSQWRESALNRYGILTQAFPAAAFRRAEAEGLYTFTTSQAKLSVARKGGAVSLASADGKRLTRQTAAPQLTASNGYEVRFGLEKDERLYGLGDVNRDNVMRRGGVYDFWVLNVTSYIPVPMILSQRGWGLLMNTTWRNTFDVGKSDPDALICAAAQSDLDYYLFCGAGYRSLLDTYTGLAGRPALLPIWGYAFTYVCNQNIDAFNLVNEALEFRRQDMPCDVMGLEPGWMSKFYDFSTGKKWHPQRFYFPYWAPKGGHTFVGALARKGFKLSLWLCCDYDLGVYEEQCAAGQKPQISSSKSAVPDGVPEVFHDEHLTGAKDKARSAAKEQKQAPEGTEPWFEHLKFFVDQGVSAFKLDGANQVVEHPKRQWGNGMSDGEMHNLFPVIYAKQMSRGFEGHTKRRAMVYSAGGYAGVQQYVATWAGDTGGGAKPLASMLNLGFSGHSNHSCDMDINSAAGIHFGFLQTWAQQNNWDYWYQPWLNHDKLIPAFRAYGQLRYKLLPYLYSSAAEAAQTGYPVMRAMPLVYADDPSWDGCLGQYLLGDSLLVSAYAKEVRVPAGRWTDFWTGAKVDGPAVLPVNVTDEHGGALLVKAGAIIPTWPPKSHVSKGWNEEVGLLVYPDAPGAFTLYEDDGVSLGYRTGMSARTRLTCEPKGKAVTLTVGGREGRYDGMPATRDFTATLTLAARPKSITLDGVSVTNSTWNAAAGTLTAAIPACGAKPRVLVCE